MLRTKVTVLAGFLGAGKTTLLNALLRDTPEPLGVIVNDFGSVNVDAALVAGKSSVEGEVALQNGCVCCTIRGDLLTALLQLTRRKNPPRHIVIETSGVSDPAAVARTFLDPRVSDHVQLAAIVGCVDPSEFPGLVDEQWTMASTQLKVCDFVVLTKADLVSASELAAARSLVDRLAPRARVVQGSLDDAPTALILGTEGLWSHARLATAQPAEMPHVHEVGHHHGHHHHHGHAFETWTYRTDAPLSTYGLRRTLAQLPAAVYRAKGFVHAAEAPEVRLLVHVVGARAELRADGPWTDTPQTDLVFLGREGTLPTTEISKQLDKCIHTNAQPTVDFMDDMLGYFNRLLSGMPGHVE